MVRAPGDGDRKKKKKCKLGPVKAFKGSGEVRKHRKGWAECWGWNRPIKSKDVKTLVKRIRAVKGPRQYIFIGSGVHGSMDQALEVADLKKAVKKNGGVPALMNSCVPHKVYAEFEFMEEDFEAFGQDDHIILYDLSKRPSTSDFRRRLQRPENIVIFAFCHSKDHPYYKIATDEEFQRDWFLDHDEDVSYSADVD